jgi:hypothetical protein
MLRNLVIVLLSSVLVCGCVLFPTTHTMFEPDTAEGKLVDSDVCGYLFNNKDQLVRNKEEYELQIRASIKPDNNNLSIFFRIVPASADIEIDFSQLLLTVGSGAKRYKPSSISRHQYRTPYRTDDLVRSREFLEKDTNKFFFVRFPIAPEEVEEFSLEFGLGAVSIGKRELTLTPIKFRKVKKSDVYYGSINC